MSGPDTVVNTAHFGKEFAALAQGVSSKCSLLQIQPQIRSATRGLTLALAVRLVANLPL